MDAPRDRWLRRTLVPAFVVVALAAGWGWSRRAELTEAGMNQVPIERSAMMAMLLWQANPPQGLFRVVVLGDSLFLSRDEEYAQQVHHIPLAKSLKKERVPAAVLPLVQTAFRPIHFWYILDDILETRPDLVVIEINLRLLGLERGLPASYRFGGLSRRLPLRRMGMLRKAMQVEEIDPVEPFVWKASEAMGTLYVLEGVRELGRGMLTDLGNQTNAWLGLIAIGSLNPFDELDTVEEAELMYGWEPSEHPGVEVLREVRDELQAHGIPVLFVVAPVRLELLRKLGVSAQIDLNSRIDRLQVELAASSLEWLNLSAALPDSSFRDHKNHLSEEALGMVADRIARRVNRRLQVEHANIMEDLYARKILKAVKRVPNPDIAAH